MTVYHQFGENRCLRDVSVSSLICFLWNNELKVKKRSLVLFRSDNSSICIHLTEFSLEILHVPLHVSDLIFVHLNF